MQRSPPLPKIKKKMKPLHLKKEIRKTKEKEKKKER